jgi:glycosyltransferase involved in cell wall biosynthesis
MNKLILSRASVILANSKFVHAITIRTGLPRQKISTIYNGVDLTRFDIKDHEITNLRTQLGVPKGKLVIGFVGRLGSERKNELLVYKLVGELNQRFQGITCLVLGGSYDGKDKTFNRCKTDAKKFGKGADIRLLGQRYDVPAILSLIDLLLVPSRQEPFGRVVLEGMAAGVPVIGSNEGGIPEMIIDGHNGFLRSPDDLMGWLEIAEVLLRDPATRKRIAENGKKTVEEKFTLNQMAHKIATTYLDQLGISKL